MQTYKKFKNFTTVDTEDLQINYSYEGITISFKDWQEKNITLSFDKILTYKVGPFSEYEPNQASAFEIVNSNWLQKNGETLKEFAFEIYGISNVDFPKIFHHYKFYFTPLELSVDVIAATLTENIQ